MRRLAVSLCAAVVWTVVTMGGAESVWAQRGPPLQQANGSNTTQDTSSVLPGVPFVMRRAAAVVAMSQMAPDIAPTVRTTRVVSVSAQQAARALENAETMYSAGNYTGAMDEANRAIGLARFAIGTAMQDVPEALSAQ